MRTLTITAIITLFGLYGCFVWGDAHMLRDTKVAIYESSGFTHAKAQCVATNGQEEKYCLIAEREDSLEGETY